MTVKSSAYPILALVWVQEAVLARLLHAWGHPWLALVLAVTLLAAAVHALASAYADRTGAPYVAMEAERMRTLLALSGIRPGERFADLGSGDGRVVIAAAKAGAVAEGWEVQPWLWAWSSLKIAALGLGGRARIHLGSYWTANMREFDVVALFALPEHMGRMQEKLQAELRPGSRAVSYAFTFPDWPPDAQEQGTYLYRQPPSARNS